MRKAHDFDELVRRSTERVPDVLHHPFVWRDIFEELFFVLFVVLARWGMRNMHASRLGKVSAWLSGLYILGASAWSLRYSTSTELLSWITRIGYATLFSSGCMGILYLQLLFIESRYGGRLRDAETRARIFFQRLH
jgi:hypothetical protein